MTNPGPLKFNGDTHFWAPMKLIGAPQNPVPPCLKYAPTPMVQADDNVETIKKQTKLFQHNINDISQFHSELGLLYGINAAQNQADLLNKVCIILAKVFYEKNVDMMEVSDTKMQAVATTYHGSNKTLTTSQDSEVFRNPILNVSNFFPLK